MAVSTLDRAEPDLRIVVFQKERDTFKNGGPVWEYPYQISFRKTGEFLASSGFRSRSKMMTSLCHTINSGRSGGGLPRNLTFSNNGGSISGAHGRRQLTSKDFSYSADFLERDVKFSGCWPD